MKRSIGTRMNEGDQLKVSCPSSHWSIQPGSASTKVVNTYRGPIKMPTRWPNPFLDKQVIRSLVKQVEHASEVKVYRRINRDWDLICSQKLEQMANLGKLKKIDFDWSIDTPEEAKKQLSEFLKDTEKNPKIFRRFAYNFPNALALFHSFNSGSFLPNYSPLYLEVALPFDLKLEDDGLKPLFLDSLRWASQTLRELTLSRTMNRHQLGILPLPSGQWEEPLIFPNLEKIEFEDNGFDSPTNFLTGLKLVALGSGKMRNSTPKLQCLLLRYLEDESLDELLGISPEYPDISRWNNLTQIEIRRHDSVETLNKFISCLLYLVKCGMSLTSFSLESSLNEFQTDFESISQLPRICNAFTEFLATQAKSLKNLHFFMELDDLNSEDLNSEDIDGYQFKDHRIEFPVFQSLTHLSLNICNIRKMQDEDSDEDYDEDEDEDEDENPIGDLIIWKSGTESIFPQLKHLTLNGGEDIDALLSAKVDLGKKKLNLQHLEVTNSWEFWGELENQLNFGHHIQSVDVFKCHFVFLPKGGEEIPWVDSLQKLIIKDVRGTLKLGHLNEIKELIVEDEREINGDNYLRFLRHFDGVASLNLKTIRFRIFKLEDDIKGVFTKKFPFPVDFEDKDEIMEYMCCEACYSSDPL